MPISLADQYLNDVYTCLGLSKANSKEKYNRLADINSELDRINSSLPKQMNVKTTGTINERLVQLALEGFMPESWYSLNDNKYQWLGDFGVQGYPLSVVISVKSFKTKERLLVSGTGSLHAPTIGWGRFDDKTEFSEKRLEAYLFRGFLAIYMPKETLDGLSLGAKQTLNFYRRPFLRAIDKFGIDMLGSCYSPETKTGVSKLLDISSF